jgi:hypothetical protein
MIIGSARFRWNLTRECTEPAIKISVAERSVEQQQIEKI